MKSELIKILSERGFIHQATDLSALDAICADGPITGYIGFDLTAPSLHVGSLIQIMALRWMVRTGHEPIILLGEATTRIGDPTGKDKARPILGADVIEDNRIGIQKVFDRLVGSYAVQIGQRGVSTVSNMQWFNDISMMEYLQMYGPHFSINRMLTFDSVQERLSKQDSMSFLEFNYMLLQAIDFLELHETRGCVLQVGGSDQWGNIVNGVELVRRVGSGPVFGLTTPLLTNAAGQKMGKSVDGAIWLDPEKTSAFDFFQFWHNVEDGKVEEFLKLFTVFPVRDIAEWVKDDIVAAKKFLAFEVTGLVHGTEEAVACEKAAAGLAKGETFVPGTPEIELSASSVRDLTIGQLFVTANLCSSGGDADRLAKQNGLRINDQSVQNTREKVDPAYWTNGKIWLQKGKKAAVVVRIVGDE